MAKRFLLFILFSGIIGIAQAQQNIKGRVLDNTSQLPISGASVSVPGTPTGANTTKNGYFNFPIPAVLPDSLFISRVGYRPRKVAFKRDAQDYIILLEPSNYQLSEVTVTGYETNQTLQRTAGSIGLLTPRDLQRFNTTTLVPALNTLPGVRMEERATGSYRISIRGSSLRAPFGVRNVKMYLNDIPMVEANGTLPLNLLDAATIGRVEVIKGPGGSVYGAGTGGTILLETVRPRTVETSLIGETMVGSYGLQRYALGANMATERAGLLVKYSEHKLEGYRQQSELDRRNLLISGQFYPSDKQTLRFHGVYSKLYYELPGALTLEQYNTDPRQARPLNRDQQVNINLEGVNIGLSHQYDFNEHWSNSTSVFGVFSFLHHPFTNDYERNANQAFGGRTKTTYQTNLGLKTTGRFTLGGEYSQNFVDSRHFANNAGQLGRFSFNDEVAGRQGFVFAQAELELPAQYILTVGSSLNFIKYRLTRLTDASQNINLGNTRRFEPQLSPRVALAKVFTEALTVHGSISSGFSPPTEAEIRPSVGNFNTSLNPERGINYEAGFRGSLFNQKLTYDVVGFKFKLKETIVTRTAENGTVLFLNAGETNQKGLETALSYVVVQEPSQNISLLRVWNSATFNHFRFGDYTQNDVNFSGNKLTGTPATVLVMGLDAESRFGLYANITANYTSDIPLNDPNTVYSDSYFIGGGRVGLKRKSWERWQTEVYGGVENIFDKTYSLGNDLNGFGNRYFQAAPGRSLYGGLNLKYILSKQN